MRTISRTLANISRFEGISMSQTWSDVRSGFIDKTGILDLDLAV